jgi:hypothetical protein
MGRKKKNVKLEDKQYKLVLKKDKHGRGFFKKVEVGKNEAKQGLNYVRNYDPLVLYHLYCMAGGKLADMIRILDMKPKAERALWPAASTIYKIAKLHDWETKYKEFNIEIERIKRSKIALTHKTLNDAANYVINLYIQKLAAIAEKVTEIKNENGDMIEVAKITSLISHKDVKTLWQITRTERGLTTHIQQTNQVDETDNVLREQRIKETLGDELVEFMREMPDTEKQRLSNLLNSGDEAATALIDK